MPNPTTQQKPKRQTARQSHPRKARTRDKRPALLGPAPSPRPQRCSGTARIARSPPPHREGLEHAFHVVMNSDPLRDSEDEEEADENTRHDLLLRLRIINRLRGKEPTPEPEHVPKDPVPFTLARSR